MAEITISLHSGEEARLPQASTLKDALSSLVSNKQRKQIVAAFVGDTIVDLLTPITEDSVIRPITKDSEEGLGYRRCSLV